MKDYLGLCKLRVVMLMLLTAAIGMFLAVPPFTMPWRLFVLGLLGIGLTACSGGAFNHLAERHSDALMERTRNRPLAAGRLSPVSVAIFASVLSIIGLSILVLFVNVTTAVLTFITLVGYAGIYTLFLKRATPQNIVIGGLAGAAPPMLGWTAISGQFEPVSLLLVLIIFLWTPPHFWALSIVRLDEYKKTNIPMLPVTHGVAYTKLNIVIYSWLLVLASLLPVFAGMGGLIYLAGAMLLGTRFIFLAHKLKRSNARQHAQDVFNYSITYLAILFLVLLAGHFVRVSV